MTVVSAQAAGNPGVSQLRDLAAAIPSGNGQDTVTSPAYPTTGQTAYGTYQNPHKSR